jgi:uncharacterized RDD family membrane protein YckC
MSTPAPGQSNPYAPPKAAVQDVDEPHDGELAGRATRLAAYILDALIGAAIVIPVAISAGFSAARRGHGSHFMFQDVVGLGGLISVIGLVVWIVVTIHLVRTNGQTLGKRIVGIKVVRKDGSPASLGRIFWLRNVVNALPGSIPYIGWLYGLADALLIFSESRQCLHDKIADTIVIKA